MQDELKNFIFINLWLDIITGLTITIKNNQFCWMTSKDNSAEKEADFYNFSHLFKTICKYSFEIINKPYWIENIAIMYLSPSKPNWLDAEDEIQIPSNKHNA